MAERCRAKKVFLIGLQVSVLLPEIGKMRVFLSFSIFGGGGLVGSILISIDCELFLSRLLVCIYATKTSSSSPQLFHHLNSGAFTPT